VSARAGRRQQPPRRRADAGLRTILDASADGVVVVDQDGIVCFANPAAEQLFSRRAEELIGHVFGFPLVADATAELDVLRPSGATCVVEMRVVAIEWAGRPAHLATLRDVTERKQAEAERAALIREQAARMEAEAALQARDEFLATTAHELKTPLTRLHLCVQRAQRRLAREGQRPPAYVQTALEQIALESEHLARLVSQMLALPEIESRSLVLERAPTDLRQLVEGVVAQARATVGEGRLLVHSPPAPVEVSIDPQAVEQIVTSAVGNALRASPPGSPIEVELTTHPASLSSEHSRGSAQLAVRDHGMAVPPEDRPRLFGHSFDVHSNAYVSGLGLWLYVSRQLATAHGGCIDIEFPEDGGTRVVLSLPLA